MHKSFESQAKILLLFIAFGFFLVCVIAFLALFGLKDEYDRSLANHLQKSYSLQKIQAFYHELATTPSKTLDYNIVLANWEAYKSEPNERTIIATLKQFYQQVFLHQEVEQVASLRQRQLEFIKELDSRIYDQARKSPKPKEPELLSDIAQIIATLDGLVQTDITIALLATKIADSLYNATLWLLFVFAFLVSFGTLYFASLMLGFVRGINHKLQQTIDAQTSALKQTNENLQKTIAYEIEQSRKKDQIMYQQARLASMGEMIQNIAHQWRQPLNSLIILFQSFKLKYEQQKLTDDFVAKETEFALKIAKNMSDTIENFRNFFRPNLTRERFSLTQSIQDSIRLIKPTLEQNHIEVFFTYTQDLEMFAYENAFAQVVLNIIKNSQDIFTKEDALEDAPKGVVQITLKQLEQDCDSTPFVLLEIMDNGGGIKLKDIDKIFEPYFTTKHKSIGTGIGLYMVRQIVEKQMGGSIEVRNDVWQCEPKAQEFYGAIFMIRFPLHFQQDN